MDHPSAAYEEFAARCRAEGMEPMSRKAWEVCRHPLTWASMEKAWIRTVGSKRCQGWKRGPSCALDRASE